jgi:ribonuclease HI
MIVVYIDGLCEPVNPGGTATFGYVIRDDSGSIIASKFGIVGKGPAMSNNVAEYAALCEALGFLLRKKRENSPTEVRGDSALVVNQMSGKWKLRKGLYSEKYQEAVRLRSRFTDLRFRWIPREENEEADALSREAYSEAARNSC